jgi:flagellar motor switch protein FliN/FliY
MVQSSQDPSGGSQQPLSQEDVDAALAEAGLNPAAPAEQTQAAAAGDAGPRSAPGPEAAVSPAKATSTPPDRKAVQTGSVAPAAGAPAPSQKGGGGTAPNATAAAQNGQHAKPHTGTAAPAGSAEGKGLGQDDGALPVDMPDFPAGNGKGKALELNKLQMLEDVQLQVRIELGRTRMLVQDVLRLDQGSVVELDKLAGDPVDVYVNERLVARGEVLVLNDNFCVRVNEIVSTPQETFA